MARLTRSQRLAKNKADQEKLNRERENQQHPSVGDLTAAAASTQAHKQEIPPAANLPADSKANQKTDNRPDATRAEQTIANCTIALFILACVQVAVMVKQNWIMQDSMAQTDKTLELMRTEQRPWIAVSGITLFEPLEVGKPVKPLIQYKNTGPHPGHIKWLLGASSNLFKGRDINKVIQDFELQKPIEDVSLVVAPTSDMVQTMNCAVMTQDWFDRINSGEVKLIIIGKFTYSDLTNPGVEYETTFMYQYLPERKGLSQFLHRGEYSKMK